MPREKQPTDEILWNGTPEDLDDWISSVLDRKRTGITDINVSDVE